MKTYEYHPPKESIFEGVIKIEIPTYRERLSLLGEMETKTKDNELARGMLALDLVEKRTKSVLITCKKLKLEITSLEDLGYYKEGAELINELGRIMVSGILAVNP